MDFATGSASSAGSSSKTAYKRAHGWVMVAAWGVMLPLGMFAPRFFKSLGPAVWLRLHGAWQALALVLACVGTGLGFYADTGAVPAHRAIGLVVMSAGVLLLLAGLLRPAVNSPRRAAWAAGHFWGGRAACVLACANVYVGIFKAPLYPGQAFVIAYSVLAGVIVALFVVFEQRRRVQARKVAAAAAPPKQVQSFAMTGTLPPPYSESYDAAGGLETRVAFL